VGGVYEVAIDLSVAQIQRGAGALDKTAVFIGLDNGDLSRTQRQGQAYQRASYGHAWRSQG